MSDGTGAPGQAPQGQPPAAPVPPAPYPGAQPVPPAPGGFGPPPASYGPPVPSQQPVVPPVPAVPQPPAPQPVPQPVQPQPVPPQQVQPPVQPQPQPVQPQPVPPQQVQPPVQPQQPVQPQPMQPQPVPPQQPMQPQPPAQAMPPQQQWQPQPQPQPVQPQHNAQPDWAAMADRNEAEAKRKGRMKIIVAAVAVVVVGGLIAGGLMLMKKDDGGKKTVAEPTPTATATTPASSPSGKASASGSPSAAPEDPSKALWEATTDPAPQDAAALFSALTVTVNGATWNRTVVSLDSPCWDGNSTVGGLGKILGDQGCRQVLRATYVSGDSAVTVGVAVFDHKQQAETSMKSYVGHLKGAAAPGSPAFCATPGCTNTKATLGRYAYFTVEGSAKGGNTADATATAAAPGFGEHVKNQLLQRAKSAAPAATPAG